MKDDEYDDLVPIKQQLSTQIRKQTDQGSRMTGKMVLIKSVEKRRFGQEPTA